MADPHQDHRSFEPSPALGVPATVHGAPGVSTPLRVNVRNDADQPRVLLVAALGVDPGWLSEPVRTALVAPGETVPVTLHLTPARGSLCAEYPLAVTAQALDPATGQPSGAPTGMSQVHLVVSPRTDLSLHVEPAEMHLIATRRFQVVLRNNGTQPAAVRLTPRGAYGLPVHLSREQVEVPPGATVRVSGRARVRRPRMWGFVGRHQYLVEASSSDVTKHAEALAFQRPLVPPILMRGLVLFTVLSVWAAAALALFPQVGQWVRQANDAPSATTTTQRPAPDTDQQAAPGSPAGEGSDAPGTSGSGSSTSGGATPPADQGTDAVRRQLTGTVAGETPAASAGVQVRLAPTSLVDEEAQGGIGIGIPENALNASGLRPSSAFTKVSARSAAPERTVTTGADGTWSFPAVTAPGYYLLQFTKAGFQTRTYVVDAASEAAAQPLKVPMASGQGRLQGTIRGPQGPVGGAKVTISDGTHTVTTSSNNKGQVGRWSVDGISTPSTYVVQASLHGMSSEAAVVTLGAGGSSTTDLRLVSGVGTLSGTVSRIAEDGRVTGLGAATVSVTDGAGVVRTASTLTEGKVGWYTLPALPAPGKYSVTLKAAGYSGKTSTVVFKRGQSSRVLSAVLDPETGGVSGRVSGPQDDGERVGLADSGLTLSNAQNTYKTTSTSSPPGGYQFSGVAPGSYTLSTERFGMVTDRVTVTVTAGRVLDLDRNLEALADGVVPATAQVIGQVTEKGGKKLAPCPNGAPDDTACVVVQVTDPATDTAPEHSWTTQFRPGERYTLPSGPGEGLRPGLHTVTVTAPGYARARVKVQVGVGAKAVAPNIELEPVPVLNGTLADVQGGGALAERACVWVVPGTLTSAPTFPDCVDAMAQATSPSTPDTDKCLPTQVLFDGVDQNPARACAWTTRSFTLQLASAGDYTVFVVPTDPLLAPTAPQPVTAASGSVIPLSVTVHRNPIAELVVRVPGPNNQLVPSVGTTVTVSPDRTLSDPLVTDAQGRVTVRGLRAVPQTFRAVDATRTRQSGTLTRTLRVDSTTTVYLDLVDPMPEILGRVVTQALGTTAPVSGAAVKFQAVTGYGSPEQSPPPRTTAVSLTTGAGGCFAVAKSGSTVASPPPECGTIDGRALTTLDVRSDLVSSLTITAPGYDTFTTSSQSFATMESLELTALPIAMDASVILAPSWAAEPDWSKSVVEVQTQTAGTPAVTATMKATPGNTGLASFAWTQAGLNPGRVQPGRYTVQVTVPGYQSQSGELVCRPGATCRFENSSGQVVGLTLRGKGSLEIRTVPDVPGASVVQASVTPVVPFVRTPDGWTLPVDPASGHRVRVQAPGHGFLTLGRADGPTMSCSVGGAAPADTTTFTVEPDTRTVCTVTLTQLGSIQGTASSVLVPTVGSPQTAALNGVPLLAARCLDTGCTEVDTTTQVRADTTTNGSFTLTGTASTQGLAPGTWRVQVDSEAYVNPAIETPGDATTSSLVQVAAGEAVTGRALSFRTRGVSIDVTVVNDQGQVLPDEAVLTMSPVGSSLAPLTATTTGSGSNRVYRFTDVAPGPWTLRAKGTGFNTTKSITVTEPTGPDTVLTQSIVLTRTVGLVTVNLGSEVKGAGVRITCAAPGGPGCPGSSTQAVSVTGQALTMLTTGSEAGGVLEFTDVPIGRFTVQVTASGYQLPAGFTGEVTTDPDVPAQLDATLTRVVRDVRVSVDTAGSAQPLAGSVLTLTRATPGKPVATPAEADGPQTTTLNALGSGFVGDLAQVPAGCWSVTLTQPAHHFAQVNALTGLTGDPELACPAGTLTVPRAPSAGTAPVTATLPVRARQLSIRTQLNQALSIPGTDYQVSVTGPGVDLTLTGADGEDAAWWVSPAAHTVIWTVPNRSAVFWPKVQWDVPSGSQDSHREVTLAEQTAKVSLTFRGLATGDVPEVTFKRVSETTYRPVPQPADGAAFELHLPQGQWEIRAEGWTGGPDGTTVDVTDLRAQSVTLGSN